MTRTQATASVFVTALKALPKGERDAVVQAIARDKSLRGDPLDLAIIEERRSEPARAFRDYLKARQDQ